MRGSFTTGLEHEVASHRANNQQAVQASRQVNHQTDLTIGHIRSTPGLKGTVEVQLSGMRDQAPVLSSAPSAPAPGVDSLGGHNGGRSQTPPEPSTAYQYTAGQLYHQTGGGIRVSGSSPVNASLHGTTSDIDQQMVDARAKFAEIHQQQNLSD